MWNEDRVVALVGRPNVGKSRLFNRLAGRRIAIVHDQPGVTRDVNSTEVEDGAYQLLDTGGLGLQVEMSEKELVAAAEDQVFFAIEAATLVCFVVDGRQGCVPMDETLASDLRRYGKKTILVINKVDQGGMEPIEDDFSHLGFDCVVLVSAEHGYNISELQRIIKKILGPAPLVEKEPDVRRTKLCFIGRPNVGKSSMCNALLKNERLVVSDVPGTTRDCVEQDLEYISDKGGEHWYFRLFDTAGVRRNAKLSSSVEYFSTVRSRRAMEFADVVFIVLDARDGVTKQDKALMAEVNEAGKATAVIVNKWDYALETFEEEPLKGYESEFEFRDAFVKAVRKELFALPSSPIIFASAKTGFNLAEVLKVARAIDVRCEKKLPTPKLNQVMEQLLRKREPRYIDNKRFKIYYSVHVGARPFKIKIFCNRATKLEESYRRYLEKGLSEAFGLEGCPITFELIGKTVRYAQPTKGKK
ncbi:MAG: ribosome biogenesis GTPase Der [Opitutales bacterium]|nr:ribosome biogenesis GTPase Der [Opitutales bacterium]